MKDNAKRERFKKVAVKRMEKLIADFELLGNCSSLASYEYTDAEVTAIFEEIGVVPCKCSRKIPKNLLN